MKPLPIICLLAISLFASSCSVTTYAPIEDSLTLTWKGKTHAQVIDEYGAPDRETSDGKDGVILIYEKTVEETHASPSTPGRYGPDYDVTTYENKEYTHFYIDRRGIVTKVKSNLEAPSGKRIDWGQTCIVGVLGVALTAMIISHISDRSDARQEIRNMGF